MISKKTCSKEDCNYPAWSKGVCKMHTPKTPLRKISVRGVEKKKEKAVLTDLQFELFKEFYKEHPIKRCYECNRRVDGKSSAQFHHLLFKSQFPQYRLEKWNLALVCSDCHNLTHNNIDKTPKIKELTEIVKEKYNK